MWHNVPAVAKKRKTIYPWTQKKTLIIKTIFNTGRKGHPHSLRHFFTIYKIGNEKKDVKVVSFVPGPFYDIDHTEHVCEYCIETGGDGYF